MRCPQCKSKMESRPVNHKYTESGLPNVLLLGLEVRHCSNCGEEVVAIPRLEELHRLLAFKVASQRARLNGAEVRFLRKWLGWSGADFARTMGVEPETVSRWENDKEPMGATADRLLRLMAIREKPLDEYPTEMLADVAQEDAPRVRLAMRVSSEGWQADDAAA